MDAVTSHGPPGWDAVVDAATDFIVAYDTSLRITNANRAAATRSGRSADELVGMSCLAAFPFGPDEAFVRGLLERTLLGEPVWLDYTPTSPEWRFTLAVRGFPIENAEGRVIGGAVMGRDVTAERQATEQRLELEREVEHERRLESLSKLAGGIAHDFNNLLAAMNLTAEMLVAALPDGSAEQAQATRIIEVGRRATELTARLTVFARQEAPLRRRIDVNDVIRQADALLARTLGEHIDRRLDLADVPCMVDADPALLQQVVVNLAANARDAMPDGGVVRVSTEITDMGDTDHELYRTRAVGPHVVLSVTDQGSGMDEQTRRQAFEPFFSTKAVGKGTGLGLATVFGMARQAGGGVWIYSEMGRGTIVKLALPLVSTHGVAAQQGAPASSGVTGSQELVLLVEDEDALREVGTRLLHRAGYRVEAFADGQSLLDALPSIDGPVVLLTDVVLPGMSGPELARQVRQAFPHVQIVFMSGYTAGLFADSPAEGELISKPFSAATLADAVRRAVDVSKDPPAEQTDSP
ncbi:MAG: two-component system, cell cycle sensor histidine kinase and response regulator CckA [Actinomycetota bacterium]|nr:two-component system, cell cycle sensor histidine kinase and response regulator CckA [Actinomycetota bacterium]